MKMSVSDEDLGQNVENIKERLLNPICCWSMGYIASRLSPTS